MDDISPLLQGEDARDHERLGAKVYWALQTIGRRGLVQQAYSAFDVALWDLKAKAANLPLYKLLGGARESTPVYGSDTAWLWMSADQIVEASRPYLDQGMMGIKVKVGAGPEADAERLTALREAFGDDVWLAVDANERYDYGTALAMGRFFEEEIGADWFEEPITVRGRGGPRPAGGEAGHADRGGRNAVRPRRIRRLPGPRRPGRGAAGRDARRRHHGLAEGGGAGGAAPPAAVAAPAAGDRRPSGVRPAAGRIGRVHAVAVPAVHGAAAVEKGRLVPPSGPGLGLEVDPDAEAKYRIG